MYTTFSTNQAKFNELNQKQRKASTKIQMIREKQKGKLTTWEEEKDVFIIISKMVGWKAWTGFYMAVLNSF